MEDSRQLLRAKAALLPLEPGVYLYKDRHGAVLYVGKAKNLRSRVRSYFNEDRLADSRTGTLVNEAADVHYILVDNEKEALALENNLIKQYKPRFNVLLRDDKTYPYVCFTKEKYPRVYVTRRLRKGQTYFGPYFPANLAYRVLNFVHRSFKIPSCKVDLTKAHAAPCLEYHIHRCLGPCVPGLTTDEAYADAARNAKLFLEGKNRELLVQLKTRRDEASENLRFEEAAVMRDLVSTVEEIDERQKMAAASGDDIDILALYAEPPLVAANLFHLRNGRIVDRRELFWEDATEFDAAEFASALLKQVYLESQAIPAIIHVPVEFEDREALEDLLSEKRGRRVEIHTPQRGQKKAMADLAATNARHSFDARFRVMRPTSAAISEALQEALNLEQPPDRIECFDISHIQGTDKVASMVVWEKGRMKKADYRKFIIETVEGNDDFASMREVVTRRYGRLRDEGKPFPGLVLIDGGLGQLHAAAGALEDLGIINQPLASIAKREEIIYVYGQESEPIVLDRFNPVLHLVQTVRDEAHRFAVTFHRQRRGRARLQSELLELPGVGPKTAQKLLKQFGGIDEVRNVSLESLTAVIGPAAAERVRQALACDQALVEPELGQAPEHSDADALGIK